MLDRKAVICGANLGPFEIAPGGLDDEIHVLQRGVYVLLIEQVQGLKHAPARQQKGPLQRVKQGQRPVGAAGLAKAGHHKIQGPRVQQRHKGAQRLGR
jgi:hypothetical protein